MSENFPAQKRAQKPFLAKLSSPPAVSWRATVPHRSLQSLMIGNVMLLHGNFPLLTTFPRTPGLREEEEECDATRGIAL